MIITHYHTIAIDSYLDMWQQYDDLLAQGYTRSKFYYVAPEGDGKPLFVVHMLPPEGTTDNTTVLGEP